ncbi:MAG: hypothetical protein KC609_20645 [Myxococcales bacterium]|nr:hypothetical protein [Myxococcales bacterium]
MLRTTRFTLPLLALLFAYSVAHADDEKKISSPSAGSCEHTVQQVFKAAQKDSFRDFLKWVHPEFKSNDRMKTSWKNYSYRQLVKRVKVICSGSGCTYVMTRVQDVGKERKVFVKKRIQPSMPCPMTCRKNGEKWLLVRIGCI